MKLFFLRNKKVFSPAAGVFSRPRLRATLTLTLTLPSPNLGGLPVHHGASVGPGRAPWRALSAFKVVKSGK